MNSHDRARQYDGRLGAGNSEVLLLAVPIIYQGSAGIRLTEKTGFSDYRFVTPVCQHLAADTMLATLAIKVPSDAGGCSILEFYGSARADVAILCFQLFLCL